MTCEKCWRDADGDPDRYRRLLDERRDNPCSPEEQAGPDATVCPTCGRRTVHQVGRECVLCSFGRKDGMSEKLKTADGVEISDGGRIFVPGPWDAHCERVSYRNGVLVSEYAGTVFPGGIVDPARCYSTPEAASKERA